MLMLLENKCKSSVQGTATLSQEPNLSDCQITENIEPYKVCQKLHRLLQALLINLGATPGTLGDLC